MILFDLMPRADDITISQILKACRTIAVVGLSSNPARPSYGVGSYMQGQGYRVIPVNPNETNVLGEPSYPSLASVPGTIDLVDIFRKSEDVLLSLKRLSLVAPKRFGCRKVW
jgi:predicted CoA-binding protein